MMNIFRAIDKKFGFEGDKYTLNYEAYDTKGNTIESGILVNEDIKNIVNIADNNKVATMSFNVQFNYMIICNSEINIDYFVKDTIKDIIQNTNHYNMTRKHRKQLNKILN